jgi:hypothetical protein
MRRLSLNRKRERNCLFIGDQVGLLKPRPGPPEIKPRPSSAEEAGSRQRVRGGFPMIPIYAGASKDDLLYANIDTRHSAKIVVLISVNVTEK